jgi:hypothetical protein
VASDEWIVIRDRQPATGEPCNVGAQRWASALDAGTHRSIVRASPYCRFRSMLPRWQWKSSCTLGWICVTDRKSTATCTFFATKNSTAVLLRARAKSVSLIGRAFDYPYNFIHCF